MPTIEEISKRISAVLGSGGTTLDIPDEELAGYLHQLIAEIERLEADVAEHHRLLSTNLCYYCGAKIVASQSAMTKHVMSCTKHPLSGMRERVEDAEGTIKRLSALLDMERDFSTSEYERAEKAEAEVRRLGGKLPCGHSVGCMVSADEGTNYCGWCASEHSVKELELEETCRLHIKDKTYLRRRVRELVNAIKPIPVREYRLPSMDSQVRTLRTWASSFTYGERSPTALSVYLSRLADVLEEKEEDNAGHNPT